MADENQKPGFATRAIHAGQEPDPATGAVMTPIFATSTFRQRSPGVHTGYEYARTQNPTRHAFERCIADLEGGGRAFAFASGLAASATVLELLEAGSHIVAVDDMYGGSWRLFERVRKRSMGLRVSYADPNVASAIEKALEKKTRLIWVESPTNPLLKVTDLAQVGKLGQQRGIITVVDNTFCSPYVQRPLELGCDLVVHSVTKYINGHSDMVGGIVVVRQGREDLAEKLEFMQNAIGSILDPFSSFLALRGVKTLPLRMKQHNGNAMHLASWLQSHPKVERVIYPGLATHPQHLLAAKQMNGFGAMIGVYLKTDMAGVRRALEACRVFTLAESLGGVESLIGHPVTMSHGSLPPERRAQLGITDNLVRVSVGIEDVADLTADLDQALARI
ncbi:MAG TPA: PLP-dependent aspartate aminotransferase family protein [Burkholderiales bacterium]|jgi:cystathionine gamma-lyase|nr:PLP-dependent aspartate aminotransferase family protein [Burkholderiales bacterium]